MKEENQPDKTKDISGNKPSRNSILNFIGRNKWVLVAALIILATITWAVLKINRVENEYAEKQSKIVSEYQFRMDSISIDRFSLTAQALSWAVRSELNRENKEQIDQFFIEFVKNKHIEKLQLINSETSIIELSTDKKDEGMIYPNLESTQNQIILDNPTNYQILTPILGLNKNMGVLVIYIEKLNPTI